MMTAHLRVKNLTAEERNKAQRSMAYAVEALSSPEFKNWVLGYEWIQTYTTGRFWRRVTHTKRMEGFRYNWLSDGAPLTRKALYDIVMRAKELKLGEADDEQVDVFLEIDRGSSRSVIGYTNPGTVWQWVYAWFFRSVNEAEAAGNIIHEWLHKIGFDHEFKDNGLRRYTFVYAAGDKVEEMVQKMILAGKHPNLSLCTMEVV